MDAVRSEQVGDFLIEIFQEEDFQNPREWDNIGRLVSWDERLPGDDTIPARGLDEYFVGQLEEPPPDGVLTTQMLETKFFVLPVFLFVHSGCSVTTHWPNFDAWDKAREKDTGLVSMPVYRRGWDWQQSGAIWVARTKAAQEIPFDPTSSLQDWEAKVREALEGEIETLNQAMTGDVFYFEVSKAEKFVDSCGGLFGYDYAWQSALDAVKYLASPEALA